MFTNSCSSLIRVIISTNLAISFLGVCLIPLSIDVHPALGQGTAVKFRASSFTDSHQYHTLLSQKNMAFFEYSGSQDIDDPLHDFSAYVIDPTMWDSTELNEPRTIYRTHAGFQTRQRFLNGPTVLRFGFEAQMDHAQVYSIPGSGGDHWISEQHQNLIDVVYAPCLAMESQPLSWVRLAGNLRMNFLAHDVQDVCPKTCSLEPKGQGTHMVPIFKGGLIFGPWLNTQFFINLGKGFYRLDEVNPVGS
ncbi:MAG: hypothetical protein KC592_12875, partial [Nitrospira sp.]|nr:hypothetical protein [Nitrospira sp.]